MFSQRAQFDVVRLLANGSISGTYATVGTATSHRAAIICLNNGTDKEMIFTTTNGSTPASDGTADQVRLPAGAYKIFDISANNSNATNQPSRTYPEGTQFWVRYAAAPSSGNVWVEIVYAVGE